MQGHILEEWRIRDVEQKAERANSRLYELDSLRNDVADLERTTRQLSSTIDELRSELQGMSNKVEAIELWMNSQTL